MNFVVLVALLTAVDATGLKKILPDPLGGLTNISDGDKNAEPWIEKRSATDFDQKEVLDYLNDIRRKEKSKDMRELVSWTRFPNSAS